MVITWYGKNCFKLQSGDLVIVTDPFDKESGLTPFRGRTDIIIKTIAPLSIKRQASEEGFEIDYPGEYEVKGVGVEGWPIKSKKEDSKEKSEQIRTVYLIKIDDLKIVLLGHLTDEDEIKDVLEYLEDADIVFAPVGGKPLIETAAIAKLIRQLKPSLVVPALIDGPKDLKPFLKELGQTETQPQEKITIGKKDLSKEKLTIGCLKI